MKRKTLFLSGILLSFSLIFNCNGNSDSEPEQVTFLCCGDNPFANLNVDNLDQSLGEIKAMDALTPDGDGKNDIFIIENIELYPNNTVTIFDLNDNIVFNKSNYLSEYNYSTSFYGLNQSDNSELPTGTYKYKIVVENDETFVEYGYVCLVRYFSDLDNLGDFSFIICNAKDEHDPFLAQ
ncbi:T9SS type B sorting domain-containing protein [Mangrovimonas xylaniphaga]|uniref:T9SS type B sorting domain-containing protein n=1 Tax=Mangrovimonas xylaniphaga TaxID=1645915 RepID=UPI0006B65C74|nr:gliding motility-associated C-terminal domain-containing protein [Mangrovimonas xylaniphaga]